MTGRAATLQGGRFAYSTGNLCLRRAVGRSIDSVEEASIIDEHQTLMGAVVGKIQSAESGLNESCLGLTKDFEVWFLRKL